MSRVASRFLAYVTKSMEMPFLERENRENNRKQGKDRAQDYLLNE